VFRLFGHYIRLSTFFLTLLELVVIGLVFCCGILWNAARSAEPLQFGTDLLSLVALPTVTLVVLMYAVGGYENVSGCSPSRLALRLTAAFVIGWIIVSMGWPPAGEGLGEMVTLFALAWVAVFASRAALRYGIDFNLLRQRILVLGVGERAEGIRRLLLASTPGAPPVGFVPVAAASAPSPRVPRQFIVDVKDQLDHFARENRIREIVVALDERRGTLPIADLLDCRFVGIEVTEAADFVERETGRVDLDTVSPSWLIFGRGFRQGRVRRAGKRAFDIAFSLAFLVFVLPVLLIVALAIKLDSPGPVFYRQERVGLGGRTFSVLKFRSMSIDAESDGQARWATQLDRRVTRVGAVIRKTRLDEFPQVLNVLRGDMSFVGPRPERPVFVETLSQAIPYYGERHRVKPGITGWAQIRYPYGASVEDAKEKLKYDLYYMKNQSLFLDLLILLKTMRVVLWSEGAR
jgi:sugar transferase (PEP-CTERM system associated)